MKAFTTGILALLVINFILTSSLAWAGSESHGGDGVIIKDKVYLLDLYEAGVEENPFINPQFPGSPGTIERLKRVFSDFEAPTDILASKISEAENFDFQFGRSLLIAIEKINWNLVSGELVDVKDENSPIDLNKAQHIQLATRAQRDVLINRDGWQRLSRPHRAALILHEALFALVAVDSETTRVKDNIAIHRYFQDSRKARSVNGYLFKRAFQSNGKEAFLAKLTDGFEFGFSLNPKEIGGVLSNTPILKLHFLYAEPIDGRSGQVTIESWNEFIKIDSPRAGLPEFISKKCKYFSALDGTSISVIQVQDLKDLEWSDYYEYGNAGTKMARLQFKSNTKNVEMVDLDEDYEGIPEKCTADLNVLVNAYFDKWTN